MNNQGLSKSVKAEVDAIMRQISSTTDQEEFNELATNLAQLVGSERARDFILKEYVPKSEKERE